MPQIFFSGDQIDQSAPNYIFSDHSVRITGIYIGNCTRCIRIFTTSVDKTCKVNKALIFINTVISDITCNQLHILIF